MAITASRTFRSLFPDHIGMVTSKGKKFNFSGNLIETTDPEIIKILEERIVEFGDVKEATEAEAKSLKEAKEKSNTASSLEDQMSANPQGETTISPQALMERIRLAQVASTQSTQLDPAKSIVNPLQAGIVSSATLEASAPSNGKPVSTTGTVKK